MQFGEKWSIFFTLLEQEYGLDINNTHHLWLLHFLFLSDINADCEFFAAAWNRHKIKIKGQASRSPEDMFFFDMIANGVRGDDLSVEDLATFGVDWEILSESEAQYVTNPNTSHSWVGRSGPPPNLNEVMVEPPTESGLSTAELQSLHTYLGPVLSAVDEASRTTRWQMALSFARSRCPLY